VFERELKDSGVNLSSYAPGSPPERIALLQASRFFAAASGDAVDEGRESRLDDWWSDLMSRPAFHAWKNCHPEVTTLRFRRLVDAVLEDEQELSVSQKDALDLYDAQSYDLIKEFRRKSNWLALARADRLKRQLKLRSENATNAGERLKQADEWPENLLVIADEAQDLVPAEWRALIDWTIARRLRGQGVRLAFLGDENQRISPTFFSWKHVKDYAWRCAPDPQLLHECDLHGSFRLSKQVAAVANEVFGSAIVEQGKHRHVSTARPDELPDGRPVTVAIIPNALERFKEAVLEFIGGSAHQRLQAVILEPDDKLIEQGAKRNVDIVPARMAKGLEFDSMVVVEPFGGVGHRLSFDQAAVGYTVLSRSSDKLLCIVSPAEWGLIGAQWQRLGVKAEHVPVNDAGRNRLADLLLQMVGIVGVKERADLIELRVREIIDSSAEGLSPADAASRCSRLADLAGQLLEIGAIDRLNEDIVADFNRQSTIAARSQDVIQASVMPSNWSRAAALLLLLNEPASARDICAQYASADEKAGLLAFLDTLISEAGPIQQIAAFVRQEKRIAPTVGAEWLAGWAVLQRAGSECKSEARNGASFRQNGARGAMKSAVLNALATEFRRRTEAIASGLRSGESGAAPLSDDGEVSVGTTLHRAAELEARQLRLASAAGHLL
jgi:hypothetical protein